MDRTSDDGNVRLVLSGDARKDQTYFLAHLSQTQLRHLSFPVGGLPKESLRAVARAAGLPNADRKDSQGICFLGKVKFSEFVAEHLGEREGAIVELETGDLLGTHRGFWFHTIGQRSGLGLSGGPWYVAAKDVDGNVVYATREYYALEKRRNAFEVEAFSWVSGTPPPRCRDGYAFGIKAASAKSVESGGTHAVPSRTVPSSGSAPSGREAEDVAKEAATRDPTAVPGSSAATATTASSRLFVKTRHGENRYGCTLRFSEDGASGSVVIERDDQGLAAGQFAVFYDGETCLGCGVIAATKADEALIARDARHRTVIQGGVRRIAEDRKRAAKRGA
jgi:tRNA-specific 2-thiouridylase